MDEELLNAMYSETEMESQGVSKDDFQNLLLTSEELRSATYSEMGFESQNVSYEDFEGLVGVKKKVQEEPQEEVQEVVQEEPQEMVQEDTESVSEDGSLESQDWRGEQEKSAIRDDVFTVDEETFKSLEDQGRLEDPEKKEGQEEVYTFLKENNFSSLDALPDEFSETIKDQNPNLYTSDIELVLYSTRNEEITNLAKSYQETRKNAIQSEEVSAGKTEEDAKRISDLEIQDETGRIGISSLGYDEDEINQYKGAIKNRSNALLKISKIKRDPSKKAELEKLQELVKVSDKKISELRENSDKAFIDENGDVNKDLKEDVEQREIGFEKEYKSDYVKLYDRLSLEIAKRDAITQKLADAEFDSNPDFQEVPGIKEQYKKDAEYAISSYLGGWNKFMPDTDPRDYISKENWEKLMSYREIYDEADRNITALSRLLLLNEDPAAVERGWGTVFSAEDSDFYLPITGKILDKFGNIATSFGETFFEEITGVDYKSDSDFRQNAVKTLQEEGMKLTEEQIEAGEKNFSEKLGETLGVSGVIGLEILATRNVIGGASKLLNMPRYLARFKYLRKNRKLVQFLDKTSKNLTEGLAFELADDRTDFFMGVAESGSAQLFDRLIGSISKSKYGKFLKYLDNYAGRFAKEVTSRTVGGVTEEYVGDFVSEGVKNGFFTEEQYKNVFGEGAEGVEKFLLTLGSVGFMTFPTGFVEAAKKKAEGDPKGSLAQSIEAYEAAQNPEVTTETSKEGLKSIVKSLTGEDVDLDNLTEEQRKEIEQITALMKTEEVESEPQRLDDMSEEELEVYAKENDLDVSDLKKEAKATETTEEDVVEEGDTFTEEERKEVDALEEEFKGLSRQKIQESDPEIISELDAKMEENSNKRKEILLRSNKRKLEAEYKEEAQEEGDTFTEEIKELAKEENKEVREYIEARSAEEVSKALDNNDLLSKVKNNESINESQAEEYTNKIYDLIDSENVVEGSVKESELYDVIEKIENYDNKTKTVKKTTSKTRLLTRFRKNAGKVNEKAFRDQVSGSEAEIGGSKGVLDVQGDQVFITEKGTRRSLGKAADILTQDITTDNILKDDNGNVSGVRINTPSGEMIINNPEVGLDMGIQLQEKMIGRNPLSDIEVAYEEVIEEEGIEVAVEKPKAKPKKKVEPIKSKTEVTKTEPVETKEEVSEKEVEKDLEGSFTKEEMTSKMDKTSLEKALEKVNALDNKLKNLSLSDPFLITPAARLLLAAVKKGLKVGISLEQAISKAKKDVKKSKEYKVLRKEDQNFIDNSTLDDIVSKVEEEAKGEQQKREDTLEDELNLELEALIEESLDTKKPKTDRDVRKIQKRFKDFISANKKILRQASPALNATIANKLASVSSPASLKSAAEYISKIIKDTKFKKEQEAKAKVIDEIRKEIDIKSFRKKGGKYAQGTIAIELDKFFGKIRNAVNLTKEEVSEKIDSILKGVKDFKDISIEDQETLMTLDFADLDSKSIESLNELKKTIKEYKSKGRQWLKLKKEARAKKYKEGVSDLKTAILGKDVEVDPNAYENVKKTPIQEVISSFTKIIDLFSTGAAKMESWAGLLNHINNLSGKQVGGNQKAKDFLKEKFLTPVQKARSQKMRNSQNAFNAVESKKKDVFGKNLKKINKELQNKIYVKDSNGNRISLGGFKGYLSITKDQAMYIYNVQKDPTLAATFNKMKKNPANKALIDTANKLVAEDSKLQEYADWVHNDFYPNYYNKINNEYRKQYDFNLPFNENYSPIKRRGVPDEDINMLNPTRNIASTLNGSLKERKANTKPLDFTLGMDGTMLGYIDSMEHFITHTDAIKFLNRTFGDPGVKNVIKQKFGKTTNEIIDRFIKDLAGQPRSTEATMEFIDKLRKRYTTAALGLNPSIWIKQMTSAPAYSVAEGVNSLDYVKQASMMLTTKEGVNDLIDIYKSDYVRDRLKRTGFDRDTALNFKEDFNKLTSGGRTFRNKLMFMTKYGDIGAIVLGGTPYYTSMKKKYMKQGMSRAEATEKAMFDFENATEATQQSSSTSELSDWQRGSKIWKLFSMFKTSPAQYFRKGFTSPVRNIMRGRGTSQDIKNMAMFQVILPSLFTLASKGLMSDEEDADDYKRSIVVGNLSGIPLYGDLINTVFDQLQGKDFNSQSIPALDGVYKLVKATAKAIAEGDLPMNELMEDIIIPAAEVRTGLPVKNAKKLTIDNLERIGKGNLDWEKIMQYLGYSDYSLGIETPKKEKTRLEKREEQRERRIKNREKRLDRRNR
tara:strand:- start:48 stop:6788 length:6741 start_codon:yes stop_codon:yes gene_type:complete